MSNFWVDRLAANRPAPAPQQQYVPSSRPWWDTTPLPPAQPQQAPQGQPQQYQQVPQQQGNYAPHQAKSLRFTDLCPECNSVNYMSPPNSKSRKRCLDCGYPIEQLGSSGIGTTSQGEATASPQIHDGSSQVVPGFFAHIEKV